MRRCISSSLVRAGLAAGVIVLTVPAVAAPPKSPPKPKLVVMLAVDQMRADYYDWYGARWNAGLRRLFTKGAWLVNARYPYLNTVTCPGHATLGTGSYPRTHGMILNTYYDRERKKVIECTDDPDAPLVGHGPGTFKGGDSAKRLMAPTLGDEMKEQLDPPARVVGLSLKARSAINMAGHAPDAVVWFEGGTWVTSAKFSPMPFPWVERFMSEQPIAPRVAQPWTKLLAPAAYKFTDDGDGEKPSPKGWQRAFPHALAKEGSTTGNFENSPLVDEFLVHLARAAMTELALGKGPGTDLLAISFSMTDIIGHQFGPKSHEVQDVLARLDRSVGLLLDMLDQQVGRNGYVVGLSSDHGVASLPEQVKAEGKDAGRLSGTALKRTLNEALVKELGPGTHAVEIQGNDLYLAPGVLERLVAKEGAMDRALAVLRAIPGVADAFHAGELADPAKATDAVRRAAALSFYPGRSGDILISPKPGWFVGSTIATTHGSVHDYDQHVPLLFYGAGIKPGRYKRTASPADLAPTLGHLVGVTMPKAEGRVLREVLRKP